MLLIWGSNSSKYDNWSNKKDKKLKKKVYVLTAGAPPPSIIFQKNEKFRF